MRKLAWSQDGAGLLVSGDSLVRDREWVPDVRPEPLEPAKQGGKNEQRPASNLVSDAGKFVNPAVGVNRRVILKLWEL